MSGGVPDGFGRGFRRAVFTRVSTTRALRLAWVLVDAAYAHQSRTVEAGYRLLEHETGLSGWSLAHARDDLVDAGLISVRSKGKGRAGRTLWTLFWNNNVRSWAHVDEKRALERAPERALKRALERAPQGVHVSRSESESDTPLSPPKGGPAWNGSREEEELHAAITPSRRQRDRRSTREVIDDAVARAERDQQGRSER